MTDTTVGPFEGYMPLFWRILAELAADGFVAPPDEVGDLIQGFYAEHWGRLRETYDPHRGIFRAYLSRAFYQFARRQILRQRVWRDRLADMRRLDLQAGHDPDPAEEATLAEERRTLAVALDRLPRLQRDLLLAFVTSERLSERDVAREFGLTRHRVREELTDALGRVATEFGRGQIGITADDRIGRVLWEEGGTIRDAAEQLGLTVARVRAARKRSFTRLVALLRGRPEEGLPRGESGMTRNNWKEEIALLKDCLLNPGDHELRDRVRERTPLILKAMELVEEEGNGFELTDEEVARIEANTEWVSKVYGVLNAERQPPEEDQEIRRAIDILRADEARTVAEAFSVLMDTTNPQIRKWNKWFGDLPPVTEQEQAALRQAADVEHAGRYAQGLVTYGLTPLTIAAAAHGVELLANRLIDQATADPSTWPKHPVMVPVWQGLRERAESGPRPSLDLAPFDDGGSGVIPYGLLLVQVQGTPGCPPEAARPLLLWMMNVAFEKPFFFPGYIAKPIEGRVLRLTQELGGGADSLALRWSRTAEWAFAGV